MTQSKELDFEKAAQLIGESENILLLSHEFTDDDELGAGLALKPALVARGKKAWLVARGGVPERSTFLPGADQVLSDLPKENFDLVVYLGCGDVSRPGFGTEALGNVKILNIDHHHDNKMFGSVNLVDGGASATCEIVYYLLKFLNIKLTKSMAISLLAGIFSDTGGFRHASTSPAVLEIAADLIRRGARIDRISAHYFGSNELPKLRAWARALENARFDPEHKMMYSTVTEEELAEIGAKPEDLEGIAETLSTVPEAKFAMFLKQRGDEIRGSLRSEAYKGVDVSAIAHAFGGGGHKLAAGFKLKGKIEKTSGGWKIT